MEYQFTYSMNSINNFIFVIGEGRKKKAIKHWFLESESNRNPHPHKKKRI